MAEVTDTVYFVRPSPTEFFDSNIGITGADQTNNMAGTVGLAGNEARAVGAFGIDDNEAGDSNQAGVGIEGLGNTIEPDPPVWSAPTSYPAGTTTRSPLSGLGNIYVSLVNPAENIGNDPDIEQMVKDNPFAVDPVDPFWQIVRKATNETFNDTRPNIAAGRKETLVVRMTTPDDIDTIALMNLRASSVSYKFVRNGITYEKTEGLSNIGDINDWDEYLFQKTQFSRSHVFRNVPRESHDTDVADADKLVITITNRGGVASVGQIILGNEERIGEVDGDSVNTDIIDFSERVRDDFGQLDSTRRDATLSLSFRAIFDRDMTSAVHELFLEYRSGEPALFFLTPNPFLGTVVYGFWTQADFKFVAGTSNLSEVAITVEGLV